MRRTRGAPRLMLRRTFGVTIKWRFPAVTFARKLAGLAILALTVIPASAQHGSSSPSHAAGGARGGTYLGAPPSLAESRAARHRLPPGRPLWPLRPRECRRNPGAYSSPASRPASQAPLRVWRFRTLRLQFGASLLYALVLPRNRIASSEEDFAANNHGPSLISRIFSLAEVSRFAVRSCPAILAPLGLTSFSPASELRSTVCNSIRQAF